MSLPRTVCREAGVPCSRVLAWDDSRQSFGRDYMIAAYIPSVVMAEAPLPEGERARLRRQMAAYLSRLHQVEGDCFGYLSRICRGVRFASWRDAFLFEAEDILTRLEAYGLFPPEDFAALRRRFAAEHGIPPLPADRRAVVLRGPDVGFQQVVVQTVQGHPFPPRRTAGLRGLLSAQGGQAGPPAAGELKVGVSEDRPVPVDDGGDLPAVLRQEHVALPHIRVEEAGRRNLIQGRPSRKRWLRLFLEEGDRAEFGPQSTFSAYTPPKK